MTTTDKQGEIVMKEMSKHGSQRIAAAKAGVCRQTASKYLKAGKLASELKGERYWRTRKDPFAAVWPEVEAGLKEAPGLWVPTLFEELQERYPGRFKPGQIRSLYRRVSVWRALHGEDDAYEVYFPQQHRKGEALQTDFTATKSLQMTLGGEPFAPLLCRSVLPYSNWEWARRCRSEPFLARLNIAPVGIEPGIELPVKRDHAAGQPGHDEEEGHVEAGIAVDEHPEWTARLIVLLMLMAYVVIILIHIDGNAIND